MKRFTWLAALICLASTISNAQATGGIPVDTSIFHRIKQATDSYKVDTSAPPDDRITRKIIELRSLRGGFNVNEMLEFKIAEDRQKGETSAATLNTLSDFFTRGNGKRWLNNATVWIYRNYFSYKELKQLVRFYKTAGGKKMARDFPLIIVQSAMAVEIIRDYGSQSNK